MTADILTIGDELLIGQIVNTNAAWMAKQLNLIGIKVGRMVTIGDTQKEILDSLKEASQRSKIILITGGLGPTSDDITKPALCKYFNTSLKFDNEVYKMVEAFCKKRNVSMNRLNRVQAEVPAASTVIYNPIGTAPCLWFEKDEIVYIAMPGVPFEMEALMKQEVLLRLKKKFDLPAVYHKTILTTGIPESKLAMTIKSWEKQLPQSIKLAYLPSPGMVRLRLSAVGDNIHTNSVDEEVQKLNPILRDAIYGFDEDTMESVLIRLLLEKKKTVSTAESCTGGNIARLITSVPGSSEVFKGSIVAYSNDIKIKQLQVPSEIIEKHGAVSRQTVESMARGTINVLCSDFAISVSGIAGPTGGTEDKPVGTVWVAVASKNKIVSEKFNFGDSRDRNITRASVAALNLLRIFIQNN
jgi:nicotinamide-nucleotide amidase